MSKWKDPVRPNLQLLRGFGGGERGDWGKGDLEERVLRLYGDLEWGCTGGVWVTGGRQRGRGEMRAASHGWGKETNKGKTTVTMQCCISLSALVVSTSYALTASVSDPTLVRFTCNLQVQEGYSGAVVSTVSSPKKGSRLDFTPGPFCVKFARSPCVNKTKSVSAPSPSLKFQFHFVP